MIRNVAIVFCLLVYWNTSCHGEEESEGGKTESLKENEGLSCKDVNQDSAIMKREISVYTVKENSTGDWVTTFQADRVLDNSTAAVKLMLTQELFRCGEDKRMVLRITGVMRDIDGEQFASQKQNISTPDIIEEKDDIIVNAGANKRLRKHIAGVIIERPLIDDEIFSIRIDRSDESYWKRKFNYPAFGLILNTTQDIRSSLYVFNNQGTWFLQGRYIYQKGGTRKPYSLNLADIPDGTVLGITRKSNGDVHYFKNGLDMGKAFEGVPKGVYAFFDVVTYVTQISVVNEKCLN